MKLRNKKTGEIIKDAQYRNYGTRDGFVITTPIDRYTYKSLKEFCEDWEDAEDINVTTIKPLIKDDKVRNAVRAWAEANRISKCICKDELHCITFETERGMFISFENADPIPPEGNYTIEELCGEEES